MVDDRRHEAGTTLVELLVVVAVIAVIGTITTAGIVTGFRAQLDASNVAETLDGMRIATQRVREYVRAADEVCASSSATRLTLWTDDDRDGAVADVELDIFELEVVDGETVFQRRTPTGGGSEITQLIRDDIINGTVFDYGGQSAADQPADLRCQDGVSPSGTSRIRTVDVVFQVAHPDPTEDDLETSTSVRLRNAQLAEPSANDPPVATFQISCPLADRTCHFDGSASSDPEDGGSPPLFFSWEVLDGDTVIHTVNGNGADAFTFPFPSGNRDYQVTLVVTDSDGAPGTTSRTATPVEPGSNPPPVVEFTPTCSGLTCTFDGSGSSDDQAIASYAWDLDDGNTGTGPSVTHTYADAGTYEVELTVTDDQGATTSLTKSLQVGTNIMYVSNMTGAHTGSGNNRVATVSVQLTLTTAGTPGAGMVITVRGDDKTGTALESSCTTGSAGNCSVSFTGLGNNQFPITAHVLSVTSTGSYSYDSEQDTVTEVVVS